MNKLKFDKLTIQWNNFTPIKYLKKDSPELYSFIIKQRILTEELFNEFKLGCYTSKTCRSFKEKMFFRPMGHSRAIYADVGHGTLGIKGSEILAGDLEDALTNLANQSYGGSLVSFLDHFPIYEQKLPLALTSEEAISDYTSALKLQSQYVKKYGELAQLPVPISVYNINKEEVKKYLSLLNFISTKRTINICKKILKSENGVGIFVYYYPNIPLRVRHIDESLAQTHSKKRFFLKG